MSLLRICLFVLLCAPGLAAQEPAPRDSLPADSVDALPPLPGVYVRQERTGSQRFARMALPAMLGSGAGLLVGGYLGSGPFYTSTGCCGGGDDPGLTSGLWGAMIGATLGSALGAYATRNYDNPVSLPRALLGATVGVGTGVLTGLAGGHTADFGGLLVGFSIGQGGTTALFATPYP